MPKLSCLIIIDSNAHHLKKCLNSLLDQTFKDFEVLIIAKEISSDQEMTISYFSKKIDIKTYVNPKAISFESYNFLVKKAKGKYLTFHGACDTSYPNRFEKQVERLSNSSLMALGTSVEHNKKDLIALENPSKVILKQLLCNSHRGVFFHSAIYKKEVFKEELFKSDNFELFNAEVQKNFPLRIANLKDTLYKLHDLDNKKKSQVNQDQFDNAILYLIKNTFFRYQRAPQLFDTYNPL